MSGLILLSLLQAGRDLIHDDRPISLQVPVSTEGRHVATVVAFPEESLEALVAGWNESDLSIERRRDRIFLKLLRRAEGDLHVLGSSGTLYRLAIQPADGPYDGHVRILAPRPQGRPTPEPVEMIRAMRLGRLPLEGEVRRSAEAVGRTSVIAARLAYVYEGSAFRGYVVRAENVSSAPLRLDPSRFVGRDIVLIGVREMEVAPGESTLVYLVLWKRP